MAGQFFRTITFAAILFGSLAVAYPPAAKQVDRWIYGEKKNEWEIPAEIADPHPQPLPSRETAHRSTPQATNDPFAWTPDPNNQSVTIDEHVRPAAHFAVADAEPIRSVAVIRRDLEHLGAEQTAIEAASDSFAAHCSVPIAPGSRYAKPFSATGVSPESALETLLSDVRAWLARKRSP